MEVVVDEVTMQALKRFGDMMRNRRQQSEWSFLRLSEKIGVPIPTISAVENGEIWPTATDREAISDFLGYGVDAFDKILRKLQLDNTPNVVSLTNYRNKNGKGLPYPGV
ncbi:helix-turn-helix transcriptional regulator [Rhizobium sp. FKY42]|uniref:helix-turn-helix domain-containing protein n=1 Tax=Rhizobium sp. FKY42 TaxID=2562310 RepID=UPI0010C115B0|nr:helix-turn-helix transcriptional regulator [Rhizobium sp. FKY42]